MSFTCDACDQDRNGTRVVFTTEATDDRGLDVVVAKRWVLCRPCADDVFDRIDEPSPWDDSDFKTLVLPDDESVSQQAGGYAAYAS